MNGVTDVIVSLREYDEDGELLDGTTGVFLASIKAWTIQLQGDPA